MKKWLIGVFVTLGLFLLCCQFLIPGNFTISESIVTRANLNGVYRFLANDSNWVKWWPAETSVNDKDTGAFHTYDGFRFLRTKLGYNSFEIAIEKDKTNAPSLLHLVGFERDSLNIEWTATLSSGDNPFSKIRSYLAAKKLRRTMESVLVLLQKHVSDVKNIYGIEVRKEQIKLQFLVSRRITISHYPTIEDIYGLMGQIRTHLAKKQVQEIALPIFNIEPAGGNDYLLLVAVPVENQLEDEGVFTTLKLLKNGLIIVTEVTGGSAAEEFGLQQLKLYAIDHHHLNVALPYRIFLNDRFKETDSTKWVTRLNYPCI